MMMQQLRGVWWVVLVVGVILLAGCKAVTAPPATQETPPANMANPASVNCADKGGTLEIRKDASGGEVGYCHFADGSECEEWAFMRGECEPGATPAAPIGMPNPASVFCADNAGTLDIRTEAGGGEVGICTFADGSECEEWAFMRGECKPGDVQP